MVETKFEDFKEDAKRDKPMPAGMTPNDQHAYMAVAYVTKRYLMGDRSDEEGRRTQDEIAKIKQAHAKGEQSDKDAIYIGQFWQQIEQGATEFRKTRNSFPVKRFDKLKQADEDLWSYFRLLVETCDSFYREVYGLIPVEQNEDKHNGPEI